jgi:hypothetical protein
MGDALIVFNEIPPEELLLQAKGAVGFPFVEIV